MESSEKHTEVIAWLRERGHTEREIGKIMDRVREYDKNTSADSIMDAIANGTFNIAAIIDEVRAEPDDSTGQEE